MNVIRKFLLIIISACVSISFAVGEIDIMEIDEKDRDTFVEYTGNFNFNTTFSQILGEYMSLNKSIWQPEYIDMDEFDLEIYAGGKLFRFNEKHRSLASPLQ